ncbi:MAG: hypothetical protein HY265_05130 [Deltaproteobacteria bacterium]|nr:hypothetical protein [Deltaproteobacteria bacterium]
MKHNKANQLGQAKVEAKPELLPAGIEIRRRTTGTNLQINIVLSPYLEKLSPSIYRP